MSHVTFTEKKSINLNVSHFSLLTHLFFCPLKCTKNMTKNCSTRISCVTKNIQCKNCTIDVHVEKIKPHFCGGTMCVLKVDRVVSTRFHLWRRCHSRPWALMVVDHWDELELSIDSIHQENSDCKTNGKVRHSPNDQQYSILLLISWKVRRELFVNICLDTKKSVCKDIFAEKS